MEGRKVQSGSLISQKSINVSRLSKGIYLISTENIDGDNLRLTFIKQ
jgi:hypothetical protein